METLITKEQILALARLLKDGQLAGPHDGKERYYTMGVIDGALRFRTAEGDFHLNGKGQLVI